MWHEWGERNVYRLLVGKPERKRPLGRPRHRWIDNVKMDIIEREWGKVVWIDLAQDRNRWRAVVNVEMNRRVPKNAGKLPSGCSTCGLLCSAQLHSE
jgi:hypothetical protein